MAQVCLCNQMSGGTIGKNLGIRSVDVCVVVDDGRSVEDQLSDREDADRGDDCHDANGRTIAVTFDVSGEGLLSQDDVNQCLGTNRPLSLLWKRSGQTEWEELGRYHSVSSLQNDAESAFGNDLAKKIVQEAQTLMKER